MHFLAKLKEAVHLCKGCYHQLKITLSPSRCNYQIFNFDVFHFLNNLLNISKLFKWVLFDITESVLLASLKSTVWNIGETGDI